MITKINLVKMKNVYISTLFFIPLIIISQNTSKLDHQKRVYINNDNTYVQKSLKLILKITITINTELPKK